jgi:hypothetical protein
MDAVEQTLKKWLDWYNTPELFRLDPPVKETREILGDNVSPSYEVVSFSQFWDRYKYRVNKQAAIKAWAKLSLVDQMEAYDHIPRYDEYLGATSIAKAHASTYLNQKRWQDEYNLKTKKFPNYPDDKLFKTLKGEELNEYQRHLRENGWSYSYNPAAGGRWLQKQKV